MRTCVTIVILCSFLTTVLATCGGNYSLVEDLKGHLITFHQKMSSYVKNKSFPKPTDKGLALLKKYEDFLPSMDTVEEYYLLQELFPKKCWVNTMTTMYDMLRNASKRVHNPMINMTSSLNEIVKMQFESQLSTFRATATESCFRDMLNSVTDQTLSSYSKFQLSFILYKIFTIVDLKLNILINFKNLYNDNTSFFPVRDYTQWFTQNNHGLTHEIWRRDPIKHIKGKTYFEIEQYAQGYVVDTGSIKGYDKKCTKSCGEFSNVTTQNRCSGRPYCREAYKLCRGDIDDCQELPGETTLCLDEAPRLYQYGSGSTKMFGEIGECRKKMLSVTAEKSDCKFCVCTCYQKKDTAKYISMRAARSNIQDNRVVTGIRFRSILNIIHIQVQEAKLGLNGTIVGSPSWVPIKSVSIHERHVHLNQDFFEVSRTTRGINLDDLVTPRDKPDHVVTAVRFRKVANRLALQVQLTRYSFQCGELILSSPIWHENIDNNSMRTAIDIQEPDVPTKSKTLSNIVDSDFNYVMFTHTSFELDFAQTTVPFFDSQEVVPKVLGPLQGVGIYYKEQRDSKKQYGGFLGLKLFTYDFKKNLNNFMCTKRKC